MIIMQVQIFLWTFTVAECVLVFTFLIVSPSSICPHFSLAVNEHSKNSNFHIKKFLHTNICLCRVYTKIISKQNRHKESSWIQISSFNKGELCPYTKISSTFESCSLCVIFLIRNKVHLGRVHKTKPSCYATAIMSRWCVYM